MKRILSVFINRNNAVRIIVTALFAASSEPLISWSMAGLSGAFLDNELSYEALFRNVIGLTAVLLLYCHWMSFLIILIFLLPLTVNNLLMPQQVYIFDDTIRRNLDLKGNCTDEELLAVISKVKLDKFFAANGYTLDTRISNETLQVSGGEKARIGLARSLTLPKSIVIYDEVLSGLDPQNAELIEDLLLADDERIVIHIAHNSSPKYQERYDAVVRLTIQNAPGE